MKKLMGISVIAALAVLPMAANAARSNAVAVADYTAAGSATNLATTSYVQGAYEAASDRIDALVTDTAVTGEHNVIAAGDSVSENLGALDAKIGGTTFTGDSISAAIATLQTNAGNLGNTVGQLSGLDSSFGTGDDAPDTVVEALNSLDGRVDTLETKVGTDAMGTTATTVTGAIGEIDAKVDTLTGDANTNGSLAHEASVRAEADTAINNKIGSETMSTTAGTLTGAINELNTAIGNLSSTSYSTYATKTGTLATINASTVDVVTTWGQDSTVGSVTVKAPAQYQAGTSNNPAPQPEEPEEPSNP